jgi:hemerythrin-like metal-binding protein
MTAQSPAIPFDLSYQEFDDAHQRIFAELEHSLALPDAALLPAFTRLVATIECDFRHEEALMESFQCADMHLHREQHARIQAGLHHADSALRQGDSTAARRALTALAEWLPLHIATQDRQLVRALMRCASRSALNPAVPP